MHFLHVVPVCLSLQNRSLFLVVSQVLINSIYDDFMASKIPTMKISFQIWKQIEVWRG